MNMVEFLEKLGVLYTTYDDESTFEERIGIYADMLDKKLKEKNKEPDFDRTFDFITENYPYRSFPTFNYILENMRYKKPNKSLSKSLAKKLRGFKVQTDGGIYEFWGYLPQEEKVESIRGFKILQEIE